MKKQLQLCLLAFLTSCVHTYKLNTKVDPISIAYDPTDKQVSIDDLLAESITYEKDDQIAEFLSKVSSRYLDSIKQSVLKEDYNNANELVIDWYNELNKYNHTFSNYLKGLIHNLEIKRIESYQKKTDSIKFSPNILANLFFPFPGWIFLSFSSLEIIFHKHRNFKYRPFSEATTPFFDYFAWAGQPSIYITTGKTRNYDIYYKINLYTGEETKIKKE